MSSKWAQDIVSGRARDDSLAWASLPSKRARDDDEAAAPSAAVSALALSRAPRAPPPLADPSVGELAFSYDDVKPFVDLFRSYARHPQP